MRIVGIVLIVAGLVAFAFGGFSWTDRDTVIDAGPLEVTAENREGVHVPPIASGLALAAGIVLVLASTRKPARQM